MTGSGLEYVCVHGEEQVGTRLWDTMAKCGQGDLKIHFILSHVPSDWYWNSLKTFRGKWHIYFNLVLRHGEGNAPHSSTLAWKIPRTEEPGRLQSMGSLRVGQDFTFTFHFHALEKEMATHSSVLAWRIPGMAELGGLPSMGSHRLGHGWSDLAAAAAAVLRHSNESGDQRMA